MLKKLLLLLSIVASSTFAYGADDTYSTDDVIARNPDNTQCATKVFADALTSTVDMLKNSGLQNEQKPEEADGSEIDTWVHLVFSLPETLNKVLDCPELKNAADDDTIVFDTISYTFSNGRIININYETQKSILKQKQLLASKPKLDVDDISPDISADASNGTVWTNVDPAWYAIMVTEHNALSDYIAPGKPNVIAASYIQDNIDKLYPQNHGSAFQASCTSKSAWAGDNDMINVATTRTVGGSLPPRSEQTDAEQEQADTAKSNDYYVYGDANLQWVSGLEIAADIVMTVISFGGYAVVKGVITAVRATRAFAKAHKALRALRTSHNVVNWMKASRRATQVERAIKFADKGEDAYKTISSIDKTASQTVKTLTRKLDVLKANKADAKTIRAAEQELELATKQANASRRAADTAEKLKKAENTLKNGKELSPAKQKKQRELVNRIKNLETELKTKPHGSSEAEKLQKQLKTARQEQNQLRNEAKLSSKETQKLQDEITNLKKDYNQNLTELKETHGSELSALEKTDDVKKYKELATSERELAHTAYLLRQGKIAWRANRGLLPVRAYRAAKATRRGLKSAKGLDKAVHVVRANTSGVSAKINDWLFHSTMKNITAIAKVPAALSGLNMAVKIAGDMYDYTDVSTGDYTNNIELKPFLLLGADDLPGYENEVNYGMWLFWAGSSTSAADDDAAFLQAMSFAEKFHQDLVEVQDEKNIMACDVDIYVVRPVIRNPGTDKQELYYLFMNDTPWTTNGYNEPNAESTTSNETLSDTAPDGNISTMSSNTSGILNYMEPAYDGTKIGQPCTPPSADTGVFSREILTTGRYAKKSPAFEKAMITKFRTEGGCGNHPLDRGGYTCYGVSSKFFPQVKNPNFSRADAEDIAWRMFTRNKLNLLPDAISGDVFMALWGTGSTHLSIGLLQKLLGVPQTNVVDEKTINAAKNYTGDLRNQFLNQREKMFNNGQRVFRQGWLNALDLYRANGCHTIPMHPTK